LRLAGTAPYPMAKKASKRYQKAADLVKEGHAYPLSEAAELVKQFPAPKFDQTVTLSFNLGVDPRKTDQKVSGTCTLPHGSGQNVRVLVFARGDAAKAATEAGAEFVGFDDLIEKVKGGFTDFDAAIATPEAMAEVRKLGKILGPRGLMPNPRTGTVTDDTATAVDAFKAGKVPFKLDRNANVAVRIGKVSFDSNKLVENARTIIDAVLRAKPSGSKGNFVRNLTMAASMSPGVPIDGTEYVN